MTIEATQALLKAWARHCRSANDVGLGYAKRNTIHRMMKEGPGASQSTAPIEYDVDPDVALVERAYSSASEAHRRLLKEHYIERRSVRDMARKRQIGSTTLHGKLRQAEVWVKGFLDANYLLTG